MLKITNRIIVTLIVSILFSGCAPYWLRRCDAWYNQKTGIISVTFIKHNIVNPNTGNKGYGVGYIEIDENSECLRKIKIVQ